MLDLDAMPQRRPCCGVAAFNTFWGERALIGLAALMLVGWMGARVAGRRPYDESFRNGCGPQTVRKGASEETLPGEILKPKRNGIAGRFSGAQFFVPGPTRVGPNIINNRSFEREARDACP